MEIDEIKNAHVCSSSKKEQLSKSEICGCFYCLKIFNPKLILALYTSIKIEKIYKKNDCRTLKEIVAFTEGKTLSTKEQIEEKAKRTYQKFLLTLLSGIVAIITFMFLDSILG